MLFYTNPGQGGVFESPYVIPPLPSASDTEEFFPALTLPPAVRKSAHTDHDGGYMGQLLTMGFMVHSIDDRLYPYCRPMPLFPSGLFLFILYNFG